MKQAVCLLAITPDNKIIAIDRNNSPQGIGLIGGKVEPGETVFEAIVREAKEEAGIEIPLSMKPILWKYRSIDSKYYVTTFLWILENIPSIVSSSEGEIVFTDIKTLTSEDKCPFWQYNDALFETLLSLNKLPKNI